MNAVVVRARFDSRTLGRDAVSFEKGDLGVLSCKPHRRHPRFLEPCVVWDNDPQHRPRRVILFSIAVVGIQTRTERILVSPRPS